MSYQRRRWLEIGLTFAGPIILLGIWEALSRTGQIDARFWPAPSSLTDTFVSLAREDNLAGDVRLTLQRVIIGFLVGAIPGILLGLVMGLYWPVRVFTMPVATAVYAIPKIAIFPLIMIAFGTGEEAKIAIVAISIFFLVGLKTMSAVLQIDPIYHDVARNFGASPLFQFRTIAFPGALPSIFTGLRLAMGFALVVIVGAEFLKPSDGIGDLIWQSYQILAIKKMFAGLIIAGLMGWLLILTIDLVEKLAVPWMQPGSVKVWTQAVRVFSFTASVIPIVVGSALAWFDHTLNPWLAVMMVLASVATHAGANLANDYFDHVKGIDTTESLGPSKVIQQQLLSPRQVGIGAVVAFGVATLLGLYIVAETGWQVLLVALLSLGAAVLYTGGPRPLGYAGLGEIVVFIFMGPVMVCGAYFVLAGNIPLSVLMASLAIGSLVAAILHANNIRDIPLDRAAGKVTLATRLGREFANKEYLALLLGAYLFAASLIAVQPSLWPVMITAATLPLAVRLVRTVYRAVDARELNLVLRKTAGLHLRFGLLLTVGIVIAGLIER